MIPRTGHRNRILARLRQNPVVALLGARQVGKTTLARQIVADVEGDATFFDLEHPRDQTRLADPLLALEPLRGLVILDEIQRHPELFPTLRVLADRVDTPARFLVLGSASPALLRQSSESLAGRVAFHELDVLRLDEVGVNQAEILWLRGGFPRSFLADSDSDSADWRRDFVTSFLERDLPQLGISTPARTTRRLWTMLAHLHGQILNTSELGRALGVSDKTIRTYVDQLAATFMVRLLLPWHENLRKRQVKSPKVYLTDSGLLHSLLGLDQAEDLLGHPKLGASWEGFALGAVTRHLGVRPDECFFWATHGGAELDLLVIHGRRRLGFEFKRSSAPRRSRSMTIAMADLGLERLDVVYPGADTFPIGEGIRALGLPRLLADLEPLA
ncbi:MAG: ATP-binding protein [Deltaproteobacteria bacterium]|nr:ATP-binding protein [Deltaproteobacteria bacterium]